MEPELRAGNRCFYYRKVIDDYRSFAYPSPFMYTIIMAPRDTDSVIIRNRNGKEENVSSKDIIVVTGLSVREQERIFRLCRAVGYLRNNLPSGAQLDIPSASDILAFKSAQGTLAAFLAQQNEWLAPRVRDYVKGKIRSLDRVCPPAEHERFRKGKERRQFVMPKIQTVEDGRRVAVETFDRARALVVGQDDAVRLFIVRAMSYLQVGASEPVLITGPTGVGKTHSIRTVAEAIGIPFGRVVVPDLTPAGYKGANMQDVLAAEVKRLEKLFGKPTRMILQLDEFDKIVDDPHFTSMRQHELLKILEPGSSLTIDEHYGDIETVELRAMLVLSGAFSFIRYEPGRAISEDDLKQAGFVNELIGRIGAPISLRALTVEDFATMLLADPPLSLVTQSTADLAAVGIDIKLEPEAIKYFAEAAAQSKMGARRLSADFRAVMDRLKERLLFGDGLRGIDGITVEDLDKGRRLFRIGRQFVEDNIRRNQAVRQAVGFRTSRP